MRCWRRARASTKLMPWYTTAVKIWDLTDGHPQAAVGARPCRGSSRACRSLQPWSSSARAERASGCHSVSYCTAPATVKEALPQKPCTLLLKTMQQNRQSACQRAYACKVGAAENLRAASCCPCSSLAHPCTLVCTKHAACTCTCRPHPSPITLPCHSSSGQSSRLKPARNMSPKPYPGDQGKARLADMPPKN